MAMGVVTVLNLGVGVNDILFVSFPHQLLHAISSLKHERAQSGQPSDDPVIVWVWAYQAGEHMPGSRFRRLFDKLLVGLPWVQLMFPGYLKRQFTLSPHRSISQRARCVNRCFDGKSVRLIGYAHDVGHDHTAQALLQAFPSAKTLCFGDTPGFLYARDEIALSMIYRPSVIKQLFHNRMDADIGLRWRFADENIVAVRFCSKSTQGEGSAVVLPTETLISTMQALCHGLEAERQQQQQFLQQLAAPSKPWLLLTSNFSESNLTTRLNELSLYSELISRHALSRDVVIIKPHVGSPANMVRQIAARLPGLRIVALPESLRWIPVEMLDVILRDSQTVSVSSSTALISLLYGPDNAHHALTNDMIERYFEPDSRADFRAANEMIVQAIKGNRDLADCRPGLAEHKIDD